MAEHTGATDHAGKPSDGEGGKQARDPSLRWPSPQPLKATPGTTAVAGEVRTLGDDPLGDVTIRIGDQVQRSDATGRFLLASAPAGHQKLLIDGRTASRPGQTYGMFEFGVNVQPHRTNVLPFVVWMPEIDMDHAVTIPSPTTSEVVVTSPSVPGLELHLPPGTTIRDREHRIVTQVSITPVPVDRPPFPLPFGAEFPMYFTIQPGEAYIEPDGARLVYPNVTREPPGTRINYWHYSSGEEGWYIYGMGTVTPDGAQVVPDEKVAIYGLTGSSIHPFEPSVPPGDHADDGDPVNLSTGLHILQETDLFLPDVMPIAMTRTHRPSGVTQGVRPFGVGGSHAYEMFLFPKVDFSEADLILPDGGRVHYTRVSPGTGAQGAVLEHSTTPSVFFKSRIQRGGEGWELTLKDGTVYVFGVGSDALLLQSVRDRAGNRITLARQRSGHSKVTTVTSPNGRWLRLTLDADNVNARVTQVQDNTGRVVNYSYDDRGLLARVTDPAGGVTAYTYDSSRRMITITDGRGITYLSNEYDESGRVITQTQGDGSTYQFAYTVNDGKITQTLVTDPRGNIRRVTFNTDGYMLTDTRALGKPEEQTTQYQRQPGTNLVLGVTDPVGRRTAYAYDAAGNVTEITRLAGTPEAVTDTFGYETRFNQLISITDAVGHSTTLSRDAAGNLTFVTDSLGNRKSFAYNATGLPVTISDPLGNVTRLTFDLGVLAAVEDPLGATTTRSMDNAGRPTVVTDPLGQSTRYRYDARGQLTEETDALGGVTALAYDANGNVVSVTDPRGGTTSYTYDSMGRIVTRTDPLMHAESYQYDAAGNSVQFTDRRGQLTTFDHDALNRRTVTTFADGSTISYAYDKANRLTELTDSLSGTITLAYDNLDRVIQVTTPQGTLSHTYDPVGRRTGMRVPGQSATACVYDEVNRLTQIIQGSSTVMLAYNGAHELTSLTYSAGPRVEYSYDAAGQLNRIAYGLAGSALGDLTYEYDAAGQRTATSGSLARTAMPVAVTSATYDAANRLTAREMAHLSYDANGALTNDGTLAYVWNPRNQLVSIDGPGIIAEFDYDAFGRRIRKTVNGIATEFLYDRLNIVQEISGATSITNMLTGLQVDDYFARNDGTGTRTILTDALGSAVALLDPTGSVQTEYTYDPFGGTSAEGAPSTNPLQYVGRENDNTGLYYMRARYYSPVLGRFISEDPLRFAGKDTNLYTYAYNSPTNYTDPLGLSPEGTDNDEVEKMKKAAWDLLDRLAEMLEYVRMMAGMGAGGAGGPPKAIVVRGGGAASWLDRTGREWGNFRRALELIKVLESEPLPRELPPAPPLYSTKLP